jgi:epoxyqueuosine reductase
LSDGSAVVRGAAIWALARLAPERIHELAAKWKPHETDDSVLEEWQAALDPAERQDRQPVPTVDAAALVAAR